MKKFQHILWGYELTYPYQWTRQSVEDADAFGEAMVSDPEGLNAGQDTGQLLVRGEWNWERKPIEPLWNKHIGLMAGMIGSTRGWVEAAYVPCPCGLEGVATALTWA